MTVRIRGIRTGLQAGSVPARLATQGGPGPATDTTIAQLAAALVATGNFGLPGGPAAAGGGYITSVDSNFTVTAGALSLHTIADGDVLANISGGALEPSANTITAVLDHVFGSTEGNILQRGAANWQILATGSANQVLISGGAAALNSWDGLSALLDTVFGSTEGDILQRGASAWQVLAPGTVGQVLTSGGAAALNSWGAGGGGGGTTISNAGAWNANAGWSVGQVVTYEGSAYLCYVTVPAASSATAAQWVNGSGQTISTTNTTNDTATSQASANAYAEGNISKTTGKWYFEFKCTNLFDNGDQVGVAQAGLANNGGGSPLGTIGVSAGWGGGSGSFGGLTNNARGAVAFDIDAKLFWITKDVTASPIVWNGGGTANPATGVGGVAFTGTMGTVFPLWFTALSASQVCIMYSRDADFSIPTIPTGFAGWRGAGTVNLSPDQDNAHWVAQGKVYPPGGRLSLTSAVAVQTADVVGGTNVYYVPYIHSGLGHLGLNLTAQLTLALDSNSGHTGYQQSGKLFDLFVINDAGTLRLVSGPAWTSSTARSQAIDQTTVPGIWTNTASMTVKFDASASTKTVAIGAGLYVGTVYASANGQCTCQFNPAAAAGGSNTIVGLFNAYNQVVGSTVSRDNTASWTYGTNTWRSFNNSTSNRISWLDGLGVITPQVALIFCTFSTLSYGYSAGIDFNSTSATPSFASRNYCNTSPIYILSTTVTGTIVPTLGFNYAQAVEFDDVGTATIYGLSGGNQYNELSLQLEY